MEGNSSKPTPEERIKSSALLSREAKTLTEMTKMFCRTRHGSQELCPECRKFLDYALVRLGRCPYGERKPVCGRCPIHCYKPEQREKAVQIMRFSGPRIAAKHPGLAFSHLLHSFRVPPGKHRNPAASGAAISRSNRTADALRFVSALLVQILFAAHLIFHGFAAAAVPAAAASLLAFSRRKAAASLLAAAMMVESAEWLRTLVFFIHQRASEGRPLLIGSLIISACAAATAATAAAFMRRSQDVISKN